MKKLINLTENEAEKVVRSVFAYEKANDCKLYRADCPRGNTSTYFVENARHKGRTRYADRPFDWDDPEIAISFEDGGFLIGVGMRHVNHCGAEFVPWN
jgi:hypothetical protein